MKRRILEIFDMREAEVQRCEPPLCTSCAYLKESREFWKCSSGIFDEDEKFPEFKSCSSFKSRKLAKKKKV